MNKDFMLLNDDTIEVINENGVEINRGEFKNNNVKNILLAENKIEMVEILKEKFELIKEGNKKVINMSNYMLKYQFVVLIIALFVGFIYGVVSHPSYFLIYGIYNSIIALAGALIPITITTIYYSILKPIAKSKLKKTEKILTKTNEMKKEYEKELQVEKERVSTNTLEKLVKVSLEEETIAIANQIVDEVIKFNNEEIIQKGKIRIRKR